MHLNLNNLPLEAKLTLDISSYAAQIEVYCADYILPAPKGIYVKNRLEPVMVNGRNYYTRKGAETHLVTDINVIKENIYDEDNKLTVPKTFLLNREKFLSNESILPYRGAKIIEILINGQLSEQCQYRKRHTDTVGKIMRHFVPLLDEQKNYVGSADEVGSAIAYDALLATTIRDEIIISIDNACLALRKEVELFINGLDWNMYFVKLTDTIITIERYCDWRIYCWEQEHGAKFRGKE